MPELPDTMQGAAELGNPEFCLAPPSLPGDDDEAVDDDGGGVVQDGEWGDDDDARQAPAAPPAKPLSMAASATAHGAATPPPTDRVPPANPDMIAEQPRRPSKPRSSVAFDPVARAEAIKRRSSGGSPRSTTGQDPRLTKQTTPHWEVCREQIEGGEEEKNLSATVAEWLTTPHEPGEVRQPAPSHEEVARFSQKIEQVERETARKTAAAQYRASGGGGVVGDNGVVYGAAAKPRPMTKKEKAKMDAITGRYSVQ